MSESMLPDNSAAVELDAAERFHELWQQGERPDLVSFMAAIGQLSTRQLSAVMRPESELSTGAADLWLLGLEREFLPPARLGLEALWQSG